MTRSQETSASTNSLREIVEYVRAELADGGDLALTNAEVAVLLAAYDKRGAAIQKALDHLENPDVERVGAQCTLCFSYRAMLREAL